MNAKSLVMLAVAAGCGLVGMIAVQKMSPADQDRPDTVQILVSTAEINPGIKLTEENVGFTDWPADKLPPDAITNKEDYDERAIVRAVPAGAPITKKMLGEKGVFGAVAEIPAGMTLFTVPVDFAMLHSGMLQAKNRVDVSWTTKVISEEHKEKQLTVPLLQNIEVFATDATRVATGADEEKEKKAKNVTLVVSPEQNQLLTLAKEKGKLTLNPRPLNDSEERRLKPITEDDLLAIAGRYTKKKDEKKDEPAPAETASSFDKLMANKEGKDGDKKKEDPPVVANAKWTIKVYTSAGSEDLAVELPNETNIQPLNVIPASETAGAADGLGASLNAPAPAEKKEVKKIESALKKLKSFPGLKK